MNNIKKFSLLIVLMFISSNLAFAQTVIKGIVLDVNNEAVIGGNVVIKGTTTGTLTDIDGSYTLETDQAPPFELEFSYLGYTTQVVKITQATTDLNITLAEEASMLNEVVISASRIEEKILESPVTVEKLDPVAIKQSASNDYYDELSKLKGVQVVSGSMTVTSINTRGFGGISNTRFVQLMDGMDNAAPLLNFPTGNIVGIDELDIQNVELVPGAASALYGPNAFNGILLMSSKNPFNSEGLSLKAKVGATVTSKFDKTDPMYNFGIRYAKAFGDKFAFKVNASYLGATDWYTNIYNQDRNTLKKYNLVKDELPPNYDGLNTYGDESQVLLPLGALGPLLAPAVAPTLAELAFGGDIDAAKQFILDNAKYLKPIDLRRTGFREEDLLDNQNATSIKADAAVYYRPGKDWELSYNYRFGSGDGVYQGSERYALRNFTQQFHKLEVGNKQLMVRSYISQTDDGDSYNQTALGAYTNETLLPTAPTAGFSGTPWAFTYAGNYVGLLMGASKFLNRTPDKLPSAIYDVAHEQAREAANEDLPEVGSPEWKAAVEKVRTGLFQRGGAGFIDNSRFIHTEATYDLTKLLKDKVSVLVGGNHRIYSLFTDGTVFNEDPEGTGTNKRIKINEFGAFIQASYKFWEDRIKLTASIRYDKNSNFKGQISPRGSVVASLGEKRNHNIRGSYQTGFRNPDSQAQYIFFPTTSILLGGTQENAERYKIYEGGSVTQSSYTNFINNYRSTGQLNLSLLDTTNLNYVKPEQLQAMEIGYKTAIGKLYIDWNFYFNIYKDFIAQTFVVGLNSSTHKGKTIYGIDSLLGGKTSSPQVWYAYTNLDSKAKSWGTAFGLSYKLDYNILVRANYSYMDYKIDETADPSDFAFNSPNHIFSLGVGSKDVKYGIGFDLSYRWQTKFMNYSSFANGEVPAFGSLDAMISYTIPKAYSQIKFGGTNLAGPDYNSAFGGPWIGRTIYLSYVLDGLFGKKKS